MKQWRVNLETSLYFLSFLLAAFLRFLHLDSAPLSDFEATWALQALHLGESGAQTLTTTIGTQPGYAVITHFLFSFLNSSTWLARFLPALSGSLIVLLPYLFRKQLGRRISLLTSFGLAIDAGMVALSRLVGGPMAAAFFLLLALGLYSQQKKAWAGISLGLASLFGSGFISGLLILGLTFFILKGMYEGDAKTENGDAPNPGKAPRGDKGPSIQAPLMYTIGTIVIGATGFLKFPQGLTAWLNNWFSFLQGWATPSYLPPLQPVAALVYYQPLAVGLSLIGVVVWLVAQFKQKEVENKIFLPALLWMVFGLSFSWLYPARQVQDIIWAIIPLWVLAAREINSLLPLRFNAISVVHGVISFLLVVLFWYTLISPAQVASSSNISWGLIRTGVLIGIISLIALISALVALGWQWEFCRAGLTIGIGSALLLYGISSMWGATQLRANMPQELWAPTPATGQHDLLLETLQDLSEWQSGFRDSLEVVYTIASPALEWSLQDFKQASFAPHVPEPLNPAVIITHQDTEAISQAAAYRGQDFVWWIYPEWQGTLPPNLIQWVAFKEAPLYKEKIILWARTDLFPGEEASNSGFESRNP